MNIFKELEEVNKLLASHKKAGGFFSTKSKSRPEKLFREIVMQKNRNKLPTRPPFEMPPNDIVKHFFNVPPSTPHLKPKRKPAIPKFEPVPPVRRPKPEELFESLLPPKLREPRKQANEKNRQQVPHTHVHVKAGKPYAKTMLSPNEFFMKLAMNNDFDGTQKRPKKPLASSPWSLFQSLMLADQSHEIEGIFQENAEMDSDEDPVKFLRELETREMDFEQAVLAGKMPVPPHVLVNKLIPKLESDLTCLQEGCKEILQNCEKYGLHEKLISQYNKCNKIESFNVRNKVQNLADTTEYYDQQECSVYQVIEPEDNAEETE